MVIAKKTTKTKKISENKKQDIKKNSKEEEKKELSIKESKIILDKDNKISKEVFDDEADLKITEKDLLSKSDRYIEATGRRKTAVARVRLFTKGDKAFLVNNVPYQDYFKLSQDQQTATSSMNKMKCLDKFRITVIVRGGGRSSQAEAVRHGTARVLVDFNLNFKKRLRKAGYLTRDPRMRERKKFGLKRARKSPQWAKR